MCIIHTYKVYKFTYTYVCAKVGSVECGAKKPYYDSVIYSNFSASIHSLNSVTSTTVAHYHTTADLPIDIPTHMQVRMYMPTRTVYHAPQCIYMHIHICTYMCLGVCTSYGTIKQRLADCAHLPS